MIFDMKLSENFASFNDKETGLIIFIDSFDNREFNIRVGSLEQSSPLGSIVAFSNQELNQKLSKIYSKYVKSMAR